MPKQLTTGMLKALLNELPTNLPVFFRRLSPIAGNIEGAYRMEVSTYSTFGDVRSCVIFEPYMNPIEMAAVND